MKILLLNPPSTHPTFFNPSDIEPHYPLGLLYIAAVLEDEGFDVQILDAVTLGPQTHVSATSEHIHFGASWQQIEYELSRLKPDIVGITNPYVTQFNNAIVASEICKKVNPKTITVVGGPHASARPQDFFEMTTSVDIVTMGEGEYIMPQIVSYVEGKAHLADIEGIVYRQNGTLQANRWRPFVEDLDQLPFPAYNLIDNERYLSGMNRPLPLITSRGCPFDCTFCTVHLHMGRRWRAHSPKYVLDHLAYSASTLKIKNISFIDDNLSLDPQRFDQILDGIISRNLGITWDTPNGVRSDTLDRQLVLKAKDSGCVCFMTGVESGDQEILDNVVRKSLDLSKVIEFSRACQEMSIDMGAFFIIGFPGESRANIERTLNFARMLNREFTVMPMIGIATPYYGTELYQLSKAQNYLLGEPTPENIVATADPGQGLIQTSDFTRGDLRKYYTDFYRELILRR